MDNIKYIASAVVGAGLAVGAGALTPSASADTYSKIGSSRIKISNVVETVVDVSELKRVRDELEVRCTSEIARYDKQLQEASKVGVSLK